MSIRAILLAAGRGRRLGHDHPKCLLELGGKTLLQRHFEAMEASGIARVTVVVGFQHQAIEQELQRIAPSLKVDLVLNELYERGSIVSLHCAAEAGHFVDGALWMDADVLYPAKLLTRLVSTQIENCVLLDSRGEETGEEMMLAVKDDRVRRIARRVGADWDVVGEGVGFAKGGPEAAKKLATIMAREVAAGRLDQEYEAAMNECFDEVDFGYERVDDLPWTEIDFPEDVEKAKRLLTEF